MNIVYKTVAVAEWKGLSVVGGEHIKFVLTRYLSESSRSGILKIGEIVNNPSCLSEILPLVTAFLISHNENIEYDENMKELQREAYSFSIRYWGLVV
jgi:hypothetical protein